MKFNNAVYGQDEKYDGMTYPCDKKKKKKKKKVNEEWNKEGDINQLIQTLKTALRPGSKISISAEMDDNGKVKFQLKD